MSAENESSPDEVILEVEGTPIRCNRKELSKNSDYFKIMFEGNFIERDKKKIKLEGVRLKAINIILTLLWDERYFIESDDLLLVLQAACMLQFVDIKAMCVNKITEIMSPKNCFTIWQTCEVLDLKSLYLKAKCMALMEFAEIKDSDCLLQLNLRQLYLYLANRNLQCENEMLVFQTCMKWWYENAEIYSDELDDTLLTLLSCIDFNEASISDIREMLSYPDISGNSNVIEILNCVMDIKTNAILHNSEEVINKARNLLETKSRVFKEYPCFLVDNAKESKRKKQKLVPDQDLRIVYHDDIDNKLKTLLNVGSQKCGSLDGYKLLGYKEYIFLFGGEYLIGKGNWNNNFWVYDSIRERWERKCVMPYVRRHFESCICGNYLYIIGGTGEFRVLQENMFWYNYKEDEWGRRIILPCPGRQIKCCSYKRQLFLLNINNKCGYLFEHASSNWIKLNICDKDDVIPLFSDKFALFSYKNSIFIKGDHLFEFKIEDLNLVLVRDVKSSQMACEQMESVLCSNVLYSMYKKKNDDEAGETPFVITLERLCMDTFETSYILEDVNQGDILKVDNDMCLLKLPLKLFSFHHYELIENDEFITNYLF